MYIETNSVNRSERVTNALTTMGITVVAGAVTTLGSGSFMWACEMTFFTKMAALITFVILGSVCYALFFFMPLLALFGPRKPLCHKLVETEDGPNLPPVGKHKEKQEYTKPKLQL